MVNGFVTDHNVDSDEEGSDDNEDETGAIVGGVEVDPSSLDPTQWKVNRALEFYYRYKSIGTKAHT